MKGCQIGFVVFAASVCVATAIPLATHKGVLSNVVLAQDEFRGEYNVPGTDQGIRFRSKATPSSVEMQIASLNDYPVYGIVRSIPSHSNHEDVTIMNINSTNFMIVKNQEAVGSAKYDDYIIPDDATKGSIMASMMSNHAAAGVKNRRILNRLHKQGIEETRESVMKALAMSDEGKMVVQTALALGYDHNIQGTSHPSVMKFYQVARQLAMIREQENAEINEYQFAHYSENNRPDAYAADAVQCESLDTTCPSEELCPWPEPDYDNDCFGLCGFGCTCWSFVCGDCCVHEFCRSHDLCCTINFWSWTCIMTPALSSGMTCDDTVEC